ncbi:hypothetical protein ACFCYV_05125, partial [Streptomyces sp. NPDC056255]
MSIGACPEHRRVVTFVTMSMYSNCRARRAVARGGKHNAVGLSEPFQGPTGPESCPVGPSVGDWLLIRSAHDHFCPRKASHMHHRTVAELMTRDVVRARRDLPFKE